MCDSWRSKIDFIDDEHFNAILERMNGVQLVRFTGGEPLLCDNLSGYIKKCHSKGLYTSVITNGLLLNDRIDSLVSNGLNQIIVSIDGSHSELHDSLRGVPGLLNRISIALERIAEAYPHLIIRANTVVSAKNIYDLPNLAQWLCAHGVTQWSIIPIKLNGYKWANHISLDDFIQAYENFLNATQKYTMNLLGYSSKWAINPIRFWEGTQRIHPIDKCYYAQMVAYYDPFEERIFPCNCLPHRDSTIVSREDNEFWEHEASLCQGCEPLNAWISDNHCNTKIPIFNF